MNRAEFISLHNLMGVSLKVYNNKMIYKEPWDRSSKDHLLPMVDEMMAGFKERSTTKIMSARDKLVTALTTIIKSEYPDRQYYIRKDIEYIKNSITFMEFDGISTMLEKAKAFEKVTNPQDVVAFLTTFNELHDYYYYKGMVDNFIESVSYYAQVAVSMSKESEAKQLFDIAERCNRLGSPYVDDNNLYYSTATAQSLVDRIIQSF